MMGHAGLARWWGEEGREAVVVDVDDQESEAEGEDDEGQLRGREVVFLIVETRAERRIFLRSLVSKRPAKREES